MDERRQRQIDWAFRLLILGLAALWCFMPVQSDKTAYAQRPVQEARR